AGSPWRRCIRRPAGALRVGTPVWWWRAGSWLALFHQGAELGELLVPEHVALPAVDPRDHVLDERGELERVERLRDVVDAADVEAARAVSELRPRGQEDDRDPARRPRSEEHTSELQSPDHLVCRLLLEKKKNKCKNKQNQTNFIEQS